MSGEGEAKVVFALSVRARFAVATLLFLRVFFLLFSSCVVVRKSGETKPESLQSVVLSKNFHESVGSAHSNVPL